MKREHQRLRKRILSLLLVVAMVAASLQFTPGSQSVKKVKAASTDSTMETEEYLTEKHVKDLEVLRYYKILANAERMGDISKVDGVAASEVLRTCTSDEYTREVYGVYLTDYSGRINFSGLSIKTIEGVGWARSATEIDLSGANFTSSLTEIPEAEFAACNGLEKIIFPGTVNKIGDNAFEKCLKLKTLQIGSGTDGIVDLTKVDEVGKSAFASCESIEEIRFATFGTRTAELKIGDNAFSSCESLKEIEIPIKKADNLGAGAFQNCSNLVKVGLQNELNYLGTGLFSGVSTGETATGLYFYVIENGEEEASRLPDQITYIGNNCFHNAGMLALDMSNCTKLTSINELAFGQSVLIGGVILPESLKQIGNQAFSAAMLWEITIPESCTEIGEAAFERSALVSIRLPKALREIKTRTFNQCELLSGDSIEITQGSELEKIGNNAFSGCITLKTTSFLKDLKNLTEIGAGAFSSCSARLQSNNTDLTNFYGDKRLLEGGLEEIILPDCVTILGEGVFANNYSLRTADLGTGVLRIPDQAFYNQLATTAKSGAGLEKVIVSGDLEEIGSEAFANQSRLHTIGYKVGNTTTVKEGLLQFNEGLLSIGDKAFLGCGIQSDIDVTGAVAYVEKGAVKDTYEPGLSKFIIYDYENEEVGSSFCRIVYLDEEDIIALLDLDSDAYDRASGNLTDEGKEKYDQLHLVAKEIYAKGYSDSQSGSPLQVYESTYYTKTEGYQNRLYNSSPVMRTIYFNTEDAETAVKDEPVAGAKAFWIPITQNSVLSNVATPKVTRRSYRISYVFGVKDVIIPDSVKNDNLGASAFEGCINLNEVTLSKDLTEIKNRTFYGAGAEVTNAIDTTATGKYYDYYGLRTVKSSETGSVTLPNSVTKIGDSAFENCYNLQLQTKGGSSFGTGVESIGTNAYNRCYSLDSIRFPSKLKSIGTTAFANCSIKEAQQVPVVDYTTNTTYTYTPNREKYGTKTIKKGLNAIDFTSATNLSSIGVGAFRCANVETISMTDSPLTEIPNQLFYECTFLKTITFQDKIESVGSEVLKDTVNLTRARIPASATLKKNTLSGAFGKFVREADPTLELSYDATETVVIPVGTGKELPIRAINKDNMNGTVTISADEQENIIGQENAYKGMWAEFDTSGDPYAFVLYGTEYIEEPVTVKIVVSTAHQYGNSSSSMISPHEFTYRVKVQDQPTEKLTLSAADDANVKKNPSMYVDNGSSKILYIPYGKNMSVTLTAEVEPVGTTDGVQWTSDNPAITISNEKYERGSGVATAVIQTTEIGDGKVTVKSGEKTDTIYVYSVIPVQSSGGLTCTTEGDSLGANLTQNTAATPYELAVGDEDQIIVHMNYGNTDYTEDQIAKYGEKYVFSCSDESVISIKEDGTIKALAEGDAVITVTAQGSGAKLTFYFTVKDTVTRKPSSISIAGSNVTMNDRNQPQLTMNIGETTKLYAVIAPVKASQDVTWAANNDAISVDADGNVTAFKKVTNAQITVTSVEAPSVKATIFVTVNAPATDIRILNGDTTLEIGKTMQITKTTKENDTKGWFVLPVDTTDKITWSSSNESVVSITGSNTQSVNVRAVAAGTSVLTCTAESGVSASITITVPGAVIKATGITVDKEITLNVGGTHQLNPQVQPADANEPLKYTYQSSSTSVATVTDGGQIRAVAPGVARITVRTDTGKAAVCTVNVKQPAKKVVLEAKYKPTAKKIYVAKGQTVSLRSTITPDKSTDTLTYKSNKAKIATVNTNGIVTAKKNGTAKITVTTTSKKKATITVVVQKKQIKAKKVAVKVAKSIKRGKKVRLKVTLKPAKATDNISFSVSNSSLARVDECGYITGLKKGTVKVTVKAASGKAVTKKIKIK